MQNANAGNTNTRQTKLPPALNPEQPNLTQPWRDFVSRGFLTGITVKFTGNATTVSFDLGPQVKTPEGQGREGLPAGMAKQFIIDSELWSPKGGKTKSGSTKEKVQLPKKSLVAIDFDASKTDDKSLKARVTAVAEALTDTAARGRIGSLKFMRKDLDTFEKWWKAVPAPTKTRLLMDGKHHSALTGEDHARFASVITTCPFRGPVPTPSEEEEEDAGPAAVNGKAAVKPPTTPPKPAAK